MSSFLSNIINRHTSSENVLAPSVRGMFEPRQATLGRLSISGRWQGNEESTVNNESNNEYGLGERFMMGEIRNTRGKIIDRKGAEKDDPVFSTGQNQVEQGRKTKKESLILNGDEHLSQAQKATASSRQMQTIQQRVLEHVRLEVPRNEKSRDEFSADVPNNKGVDANATTRQMQTIQQRVLERVLPGVPKDEKSVTGFSSDVPNRMGMNANAANRQVEQVIKPLLTLVGKERMPWLQERENKSSNYSNRVNPKSGGPFSQHLTIQHNIGGSQPSVMQPAIKVHIGRIEIKAVKETPNKKAKPQTPERRESLEDFLKKQNSRLS